MRATTTMRLHTALAAAVLWPALAPEQARAQQQANPLPSFRDQRRWTPTQPPDGPAPLIETRPASPDQRPVAAPPEASPAAAHPEAKAPPPVTAPAPVATEPRKAGVVTCGQAAATATPLPAGRMRVVLESGCRAGQDIVWTYGGAEHEARFDALGRAELLVDCFAGATTPVVVRFLDTSSMSLPIAAKDLDAVSKIALLWRAPVDLDLHAYEYAARPGEPGHVWSGAPSSPTEAEEHRNADGRGTGFMSTLARGEGRLDKIEVYTFLHRDGQALGLVTTAVDFASRGSRAAEPYCGTGVSAEVAFRITTFSRGQVRSEPGLVAAAACDTSIADGTRYGEHALATIQARR